MPGFSYAQIIELFRNGGRVIGRPWGQPYCDLNGRACCPKASGNLMPDCSDFSIQAGYIPPPRKRRLPPRFIG